MSVHLVLNVLSGPDRESPCLCAQQGEYFGAALEAYFAHEQIDLLKLAHEANSKCYSCGGKGWTLEQDRLEMSWSNVNGRVLLVLLGLSDEAGDLSIAELRKAIRQIDSLSVTQNTRAEEITYADPIHRDDGVTEIKRVKMSVPGLSVEGIQERIQGLEDFLNQAVLKGATRISWS